MTKVEEHSYSDMFYDQIVFRANDADCTWSIAFTTEDGTESLTFDISVSAADPIDVPIDTDVTELSFTVGQ